MLKGQLIQFNNQLSSTQGNLAKKSLKKIIKSLEKQIKCIEKQIADLVSKNDELNEKLALVTSIKGIGNITAYKILAQIPDIHIFSKAKQFAAYLGVSPRQHQSGKFQGKTTISRIGDGRLRKALYMAALVAKRHNNALQPFVKRLEIKGKSPKSIICAVMRKLAHIIFGILKSHCPFDANLA
jgi:transposase